MSHLELAEKAALERMVLLKNDERHAADQRSDGAQDRRHRRERRRSRIQSSQDQDGCSSNCPIDFATDVRTGDLGSSRVFHDPAKAIGPFDGHRGGGRQRHHRDPVATRRRARPAPTSSSWSPA